MARAGDTLTIQNLPPTATVDIDKIRTFTLHRVPFDVDKNEISPVPEEDLPSLEVLVADV
jgi:hypothetical protein